MRPALVVLKLLLAAGCLVLATSPGSGFFPGLHPKAPSGQAFLELAEAMHLHAAIRVLTFLAAASFVGGRVAPLGLLALYPVLGLLALYGAAFDPQTLVATLFLAALAVALGYRHREHFLPFVKARAEHCTLKGR